MRENSGNKKRIKWNSAKLSEINENKEQLRQEKGLSKNANEVDVAETGKYYAKTDKTNVQKTDITIY
jgi:hypothetical protein